MLLLNRFAVSLRHFQKLTKPRRWHHTSLTKHKEDIMKNVVNSAPFTCISYNRSEWGAVRFCYQHFSKYHLCALRKKVILVCNDKSAYELIENMDKKATWDRFYAENGSKGKFKNFEWFFGFHAVQEFILPVIQTMSHFHSHPLHILDMGCGTSALGPCVYKHSPCAVNVTCADISPVAIRLLEEHTNTSSLRSQNPSSVLSFIEMDCTQLRGQFESRSLDLILDKGTTDALVRSNEGRVKAGQIIRQCLQVLRTSGSLLQFSDEDPDARLVWLEREVRETDQAADVVVQEVGELRGVSYFCYQITPRVASHLKL